MAKLDLTIPDADLIQAILAAEKKSGKTKELLVAELLRRAKIDDGAYYSYTYKHPRTKKTSYDYWRAKDNEEVRAMASAKYRTDSFFIEVADRQSYLTWAFREAIVVAFPEEKD